MNLLALLVVIVLVLLGGFAGGIAGRTFTGSRTSSPAKRHVPLGYEAPEPHTVPPAYLWRHLCVGHEQFCVLEMGEGEHVRDLRCKEIERIARAHNRAVQVALSDPRLTT